MPTIKGPIRSGEKTKVPEVRIVHEKATAVAPVAKARKTTTAEKLAEKSPLQSKKFVAYIIAQVVWTAIMIMMIYKWQEKSLMAGMVAASALLQIVYLAGQARIDLDLSKGHVEIETDEDQ